MFFGLIIGGQDWKGGSSLSCQSTGIKKADCPVVTGAFFYAYLIGW